jgi:hypothetical protein
MVKVEVFQENGIVGGYLREVCSDKRRLYKLANQTI